MESVFRPPKGYSWWVPLNGGAPLDVDVGKNGDEWTEFVLRRLYATTGATGSQGVSNQSYPGGFIHRLAGVGFESALWVLVSVGQGPFCSVVGSGAPNLSEIEAWQDAVTHAVGQIGTTIDFAWWTIIGRDPFSEGGAAVSLDKPAVVAGLRLEPAHDLYAENVPGRFNIFQGTSRHSGLVKVDGNSLGYTWGVAAEDAARRTKLLCALLSVSSGTPWIQRSNVNPLVRIREDGSEEPVSVEEIELPATSPWDRGDRVLPADEVQRREVEVPAWIGQRWASIVHDKKLTHALLNHHEGMLMMPNHPSHAALAFVTTIEAIGNRKYKKLPRCPDCKVVTGSGERFRDALARVIPTDEAEELGRKFYNWRSRTAHDGVLHGTEPTFGTWSHWGGFSENAVHDFEIEVHGLAAAARRLLMLEAGTVEVPQSSFR